MLEFAVQITEKLGYFGIFFLMFIETIFPPIPSEVVMPFAGYVASEGRINLYGAIAAGIAGSLAGAVFLM